MHKTMTPKQIEANRRNAVKSTGPRTAGGKAVSSMNALKHGIFSREVLVRGLNRKESSRDLAALYQRFWDDWHPVGPTEEMLVDQIVTAHWRLRRALTAESAEIALSVDVGHRNRKQPMNPRLQWMLWEVNGDPVFSMGDSTTGIHVLESHLRDIRQAVERDGELTEAAVQEILVNFGGKPNRMTKDLEALRLRLADNPDGLDAVALRARNLEMALKYVNGELNRLQWREAVCEKREAVEEECCQAAAVLPSMEVLEKIQRYETKLERQMFRAMAQLERLQRMRQGETLPAPLSVEVSERA
jgi:hypothetical protein